MPLRQEDFRRRTWVTRPRPGIDRVVSAWLIRRFVAPDAKFAFVDGARPPGPRDLPFDMPDVEFGHHGADCTFETLMRRFGIADRGVAALSRVVHDLDLKEARYGMPECAAVSRVIDGLRIAYSNDHELLEQGIVVMEALYRSFAAEAPASRKSSRRSTPRSNRRIADRLAKEQVS